MLDSYLDGQLDAHVTYMGDAHMFLVLVADFNATTMSCTLCFIHDRQYQFSIRG